jgi:hypothetical protein
MENARELTFVDKNRANTTEILYSVDIFYIVLKLLLKLHVASV